MNGLRLLLLAGFLLSPPPLLAETPDFKTLCAERLPAPSLQVRRAENGYSVDTGHSYRELTGMGAGLLRHGKQNVLGLTRAETSATVEIKVARLLEAASGQECLSPQVTVTIEYKPIKVFIGREFLPGSCVYREILLHELRHVQAYRDHLPLVEASVRSHLSRRFSGQIVQGKSGALEDKLKAEIHDVWLPLVDKEIRKVDAAQAAIDSQQEYDRMESVCNGAVHQLIEGG